MKQNNFVMFGQLLEHWRIPEFELLKYLQAGLIGYDRFGRRTITENEVTHEPAETEDEYRKRLLLRESNVEQMRIEKNNSAEYRYNAHLLSIELPPFEIYDHDKVLQRVESRIDLEYEEYKKHESFPRIPLDRRLIPSEIDDADKVKLLNELQTFCFKHIDVNYFAERHGLKLLGSDKPSVITVDNEPVVGKALVSDKLVDEQQTPDDYIKASRTEGRGNQEIAYNLHNEPFNLNYWNIAHKMGLVEDGTYVTDNTITQRGKRLCDSWKKHLEKEAKK